MSGRRAIAIVSMAGRFPGAPSVEALWNLVASGGNAAREVPEGRWPAAPAEVLSTDGKPDTARSRIGCVLDDFALELGELEVPAGELSALTRLTLQVGADALRGVKVNKARTGAIIANIALPTDGASRLAEEVILGAVEAELLGRATTPATPPQEAFPSALPVGVLTRVLGLGGGSYTLDAACASSLYALHLGCIELEAGRLDAVLAGGVSMPQALYTQIGFTQLQALSPSGICAPFGVHADGLVVGEGAGLVVLKRLEDAERDGDQILGVIRGVGVSNDVGGSLLSPESEGQLRAMRDAYAEAAWPRDAVQLIECHGTGTPRGDQVELKSLSALREGSSEPCVIGSVKSNVGHLLTAAGMAGLAKVLQAIAHRQLPPSANVTRDTLVPGLRQGPLQVLDAPRAWQVKPGQPRRAAVSGFGFGGINAHLLVEEYSAGTSTRPSASLSANGTPVAIVGLAVHAGPLRSVDAFCQAMLSGEGGLCARPPSRWRGIEGNVGSVTLGGWIESLEIPVGRFKLPPLEIPKVLPQQLLMLQVASAAVEDAGGAASGPRTGGIFGLGLDLETTSFQLRWVMRARARRWAEELGLSLDGAALEDWVARLGDAVAPALDAQRTLGALGGIVASRVARELSLGGPCFGVQAGETSGLRALEIATRFLQRGDVDRMVVGAVDLAADLRRVFAADALFPFSRGAAPLPFNPQSPGAVPGEGASAVVLKRLEDALADGDRIYAVVRGFGAASGAAQLETAMRSAWAEAGAAPSSAGLYEAHAAGVPAADARELQTVRRLAGEAVALGSTAGLTGSLGAASGLTSLVKAALCLHHQVLPPLPGAASKGARAWARNRSQGPRRAGVTALGIEGTAAHVVLEQAPESGRPVASAQAGHRSCGLFLVGSDEAAAALRALAIAHGDAPVDLLAAKWFRQRPDGGAGRAIVASSAADVVAQLDRLGKDLPLRLASLAQGERGKGEVAFVFPGSGTDFDGMGRALHVAVPEVLARLDRDSDSLAAHLSPPTGCGLANTIVRHVTHGLSVAEGLTLCGLKPTAYIGYSLGESAGLFSSRAWKDRDVMFGRTLESELFRTQLGGPCTLVKDAWGPSAQWTVALVMRPASEVRGALEGSAQLLIVNAPRECVVGGDREDVRAVIAKLGGEAVFLENVPAVHFPLVERLKAEYRALHLLPATPPEGVRFYSAAWARPYAVTTESAADSVTDDALAGFDFPRVIERAWADGVRIFVEAGPQASCTRMIGKILEGKPHLAVSACQRGPDGYRSLLLALAQVAEAGVPVSLEALYGKDSGVRFPAPKPERSVAVTLGGAALKVPRARANPESTPVPVFAKSTPVPVSAAPRRPPAAPAGMLAQMAATLRATAEAHAVFLELSRQSTETQLRLLEAQRALLRGEAPPAPGGSNSRGSDLRPSASDLSTLPPLFDRALCHEFAVGSIGKMLGPDFAEVDRFPTRVRLPDEPLMLVDRIVAVEGEARGLKSGRVITEHDVAPGAWYLDGGRVPVCISVEAGQADLFLSAYLGIDFKTRGERVYRLLDAKVVFHRDLPRAGEVLRYDIRVDRFIQQGDTWLFFFRFDGTIDGQPFITMYDGCAGFFSTEQLEQGRGIVLEGRRATRPPREVVHAFAQLMPAGKATLDARQVEALREGDLRKAFEVEFPVRALAPSLRLPGGRMKLVDRIVELDTQGGAAGLGLVVGEHDVTPDAWYLTCHFKDDPVMPGTLMYECCLHTLRVLLLRLGWVDDASDVDLHYAPVEGVASTLKCRGQVLPSTRAVQYRVEIDQLGYDPEPFAIATASMIADGKHVVQMEGMSVRIRGLTKERLDQLFAAKTSAAPRFSREQILAYCEGPPSECFGERYRVFDSERRLARLPRPPYLFLDRVLSCEPPQFQLAPGGWVTCEYDVPPDAWYFAANRQRAMPFAVLLEAALQPCGFLAAYAGSAFESAEDLSFRNLDGHATLHREVFRDAGTLTARARLTRVSKAGGMILQSFDFEVLARGERVYTGTTGFGFFPKAALEQQVGIRGGARLAAPADAKGFALPVEAPLTPDAHGPFDARGLTAPAKAFSMLDGIDALSLTGGENGLGFVSGHKTVDPSEWFFRAHFFQDPVMPGSLGLEALLQALGAWARERFPALRHSHRFQSLALERAHTWQYRGQVVPTNKVIRVEAFITAVIDGPEPIIVADGQLLVDEKVIYAVKDFPLRLVKEEL